MLPDSTTTKIMKIFFYEPTKRHYLKEISRKARIAHTSVMKELNFLLKENLIKKHLEKRGSRNFPIYTADFRNPRHKTLKSINNLESMMFSGLIERIVEKTTPSCIILFGSYARGEDTEDSDIDLFIEGEQEDLNLEDFEKNFKRKIDLHFNPDFKSYPKELKNNIMNSIKIYGFLDGY